MFVLFRLYTYETRRRRKRLRWRNGHISQLLKSWNPMPFLQIIAGASKQYKRMSQVFYRDVKALGSFSGMFCVHSSRVFPRIFSWSLLWTTRLVHDHYKSEKIILLTMSNSNVTCEWLTINLSKTCKWLTYNSWALVILWLSCIVDQHNSSAPQTIFPSHA